MSYLEYTVKRMPTGLSKVVHLNWALVLLIVAVACTGFVMLYSIAGGALRPWAEPQIRRFGLGMAVMFAVAVTPLWFWRSVSGLAYAGTLLLLLGVEFFGSVGMGARRWLELGPLRLQPSELAKLTVVMALAAFYDWLDVKRASHPLWVLVALAIVLAPSLLVLRQPDLGTAIVLASGGIFVMFLAGVSWIYFIVAMAGAIGLVAVVMASRGTEWQMLRDYQFRRIEVFLDPGIDPLGAGYHITQAKIAMGSGGWSGRGLTEGTQSRLNFLPEKHTDFIFTTLAEELGFAGAVSLLALYVLILVFCAHTVMRAATRFGALLAAGVAVGFFLNFFVNMAMVMGLLPVVGVPLPLVSYGGTAMVVVLTGFGLVQSAHVHVPRSRS